MKNINSLYLVIAGIILPFITMGVFHALIFAEKVRLRKISDIHDLKQYLRVKDRKKKISGIFFWPFKTGETFSTVELIKELTEQKERLNKALKRMYSKHFILYICIYYVFFRNIAKYYLKVDMNFETPYTFPILEVATLIALSSWILIMHIAKSMICQTDNYLAKITELEGEPSLK